MKLVKLVSALMVSVLAFPAIAAESPQSQAEVAAAVKIAGADAKDLPLFLCKPHAAYVISNALRNGSKVRIEPTKIFDNLYSISSEFVGVLVFQTSAGLILFDGGQTEAEAHDFVEPGLIKLGLDPSQVKYVIGTHGHTDHFGGAEYWQRTYGAKVALSKEDWTIFTKPAAGSKLPNKDFEIVEGQKLTLGNDTLTFHVTPGHTLGAVSVILPAREGGKVYPISLLGMAALPPNVQPDPAASGLLAYDQSILRFKQQSADAHAVGYYNTHVFAADVEPRLAAVRARKPGEPNPFVVGEAYVGRYYDVVHHCTVAAESRSAEDNAWNIPIPPGTVIGE